MGTEQNAVLLVGTYGGDLTHALSAWCSTEREITSERKARLPQFLRTLAENGHHTPFEKSMLHFVATTDITTHIHLLKHRIGVSVNSESARYKEMKDDKAYVPQDWPPHLQERMRRLNEEAQSEYHYFVKELEAEGFTRKRAKESARFALRYTHQYTVDLSFNFRSFMWFQGLRNSSHAQVEVRELAREMLYQVSVLDGYPFEHSISAFRGMRTPIPEWTVPT